MPKNSKPRITKDSSIPALPSPGRTKRLLQLDRDTLDAGTAHRVELDLQEVERKIEAHEADRLYGDGAGFDRERVWQALGTYQRCMAINAYEIGRAYLWLKARLPHSEFEKEYERRQEQGQVFLAIRTARNYAKLYARCLAQGLTRDKLDGRSIADVTKLLAATEAEGDELPEPEKPSPRRKPDKYALMTRTELLEQLRERDGRIERGEQKYAELRARVQELEGKFPKDPWFAGVHKARVALESLAKQIGPAGASQDEIDCAIVALNELVSAINEKLNPYARKGAQHGQVD